MGVAVVRRAATLLILTGVALVCTGATPKEAMLAAIDAVLTAMAYVAAGVSVFAIAWSGFLLMAEGADERGGGRAKSLVILAVVGLVVVLLAKGLSTLLLSGIVGLPTP